MKNEIQRVLEDNICSLPCKAIRELDGTRVSKDPYLEYLTTELSNFADGEIKRLILNLPPRSLKSMLASVCLPAWILGHNPNTKIMILACSEKLAEKIARLIRSILVSEWY